MFTNTGAANENVVHVHSGILSGYKEKIMKFTDRWDSLHVWIMLLWEAQVYQTLMSAVIYFLKSWSGGPRGPAKAAQVVATLLAHQGFDKTLLPKIQHTLVAKCREMKPKLLRMFLPCWLASTVWEGALQGAKEEASLTVLTKSTIPSCQARCTYWSRQQTCCGRNHLLWLDFGPIPPERICAS